MATTPAATTESAPVSEMNIYQKLLYITKALKPLEKKMRVEDKDKSDAYFSVSAHDVISPIEDLLKEVNIMKIPSEAEFQVNGRMTTLKQTYAFVNVDNPAEVITSVATGQGFDYADKAMNAASTTALKYMYMRMFGLIADDPEAKHTNDYHAEQMSAPPVMGAQPQPQQQQQMQYVDQPAYMETLVISEDVKRFKALITESGERNIPQDQIYSYLSSRYITNPEQQDIHQPEYLETELLKEICDHLDGVLAAYR